MAVKLSERSYQEWPDKALFFPANPDGSSPRVTRCLYLFAGTKDFSGVVTASAKTAPAKFRVGINPPVSKTLDLSGAADITAVTAAEFVAAVQALSVPNLTASVETTGPNAGCVKLVNSAAPAASTFAGTIFQYLEPLQYRVQVYGDVFGAAGAGSAKGAFFVEDMNGDCKGLIPTENFNEDTTIENDNGRGDKVVDTYPGSRGNVTLEYTTRILDGRVRQMFNGGTFINGDAIAPEAYLAPSPNDTRTRKVDVHGFQFVTQRKDIVGGQGEGYLESFFAAAAGHWAATPANGAWTDAVLSLTAGQYTNEAMPGEGNQEQNSPTLLTYTSAQLQASRYDDIAVLDWDAVV